MVLSFSRGRVVYTLIFAQDEYDNETSVTRWWEFQHSQWELDLVTLNETESEQRPESRDGE